LAAGGLWIAARSATGDAPLGGGDLLKEVEVSDVLRLCARLGKSDSDELGVQHPTIRQIDVREPVAIRRGALAVELQVDEEPPIARARRSLARAAGKLRRRGVDADQPHALQSLPQPDLEPIRAEPADEPGREPDANRLDLLREEPRDLAQRKAHDPTETTE